MNRKGIAVDQLMYVLLFAAGAVLFFGIVAVAYGGPSGLYNKIKVFIPSFGVANETKYDSQIFAYSLDGKGEIYSYNGADLQKVPTEHVFPIAGSNVDYNSLRNSFSSYYYGTKRDAYKNLDLNSLNRQVDFEEMIGSGGEISPGLTGLIYSFNSEGVIMLVKSSDIKINHGFGTFVYAQDGTLKFTKTGDVSGKEIRPLGTALDQEIYPVVSTGAVLWRDAILQNGKCEKYISVSGNNYVVRGLDNNYLVVDFGKPITGADAYSKTQSCTIVK